MHHLLKYKIKDGALKNVVEVDSCAISSWNLGENMNPKIRAAAEKAGYRLGEHKAKLFRKEMLKEYDYIFVVTEEILDHLKSMASEEDKEKILLATHFSLKHKGSEIPDPYYGDEACFEKVFQMMHTVIDELLLKLSAMNFNKDSG